MSSAVVAAPIRQPRGPSANSFGAEASPLTPGPPAPDSDSLVRRHNTVSNPRHQASASVSSTPAATSAFHGGRFRAATGGVNRLRSGSLSSGSENGGLSRKSSVKAVLTEDVVIESGEEGTVEAGGSWGKGLSRQSSLPSRRGGPSCPPCLPGSFFIDAPLIRGQASTLSLPSLPQCPLNLQNPLLPLLRPVLPAESPSRLKTPLLLRQ